MEYQSINPVDSADYWHHGTVQESTFVSSDREGLIFEGSQMPHYMKYVYVPPITHIRGYLTLETPYSVVTILGSARYRWTDTPAYREKPTAN